MSHSHRMTDVDDIIRFITGGKSYFTLRSATTGNRITYRVFKARDSETTFFVGAMTGSDNNTAYSYLGMLKEEPQGLTIRTTAKSKFSIEDQKFQALHYAITRINGHFLPANLEFWHEGRCACCGRRLTVPESIKSGIGPECARRRAVDRQPNLV